VLGARVHLALPETARPLDAEPPQPKAAVLIQRRRTAQPIDETQVRTLVAGAVDGLRSDRVTVVQVVADPQPAATRAFARLGPITVRSDSAGMLKALLGGSLALDLLLGVALIAAARRGRGARRE
jgi:type III secretory pathway lipoprotein EscJ